MWNGKDCELVSEGEPIRQGDILKRFCNGSGDSIFVVITADCDIAQAKFGDSGIACVELQSLRHYLSREHLAKTAVRQFEARRKELSDWIRKRCEEHPMGRRELSERAVWEWIDVASAKEIGEELVLHEKKDGRFLEELLAKLQAARLHLRGAPEARSMLEALHKLQKTPPKDWRPFVHSQLTRLQPNQLPDDIFFISSIPTSKHWDMW